VGSEVGSTGNTVELEEKGVKARLNTGAMVCALCQGDALMKGASKPLIVNYLVAATEKRSSGVG
jgi:hypothetical protein